MTARGPSLLVANHDSNWDPLVVGVAAARRRQIRAIAKVELWTRSRALAATMDQMGQFKITRGRADRAELDAVRSALEAGACVGVFPEGKLSGGQKLRAFSGAGWLAKSEPTPQILAVTITSAVDLVRFPKRPHIRVTFFEPLGGPRRGGESSPRSATSWRPSLRDAHEGTVAGSVPVALAARGGLVQLSVSRGGRYWQRCLAGHGPLIAALGDSLTQGIGSSRTSTSWLAVVSQPGRGQLGRELGHSGAQP